MSELSHDEFVRQAEEYDAVADVRESIIKVLQVLGTTHPFGVVRYVELDRWISEGDYEAILEGDYPRRDDDADASVREEVKSAAQSYQDSWSRSADPLMGMMKGFAETAAGAGGKLFDGLFGRPPGNGGTGSSEPED